MKAFIEGLKSAVPAIAYVAESARLLNEEDPRYPIQNWMRLRATIEFLGIWEQINNPDFNMVEFDQFINEAGHQQLNQDLEPQANAQNNQAEAEAQKSVEKDPPEEEGVHP